MNVNLVSPIENGNNFVIRFKDDVVIPQNSKVYLNFATFSRENDVELYEDQTIKIITDGLSNIVRPDTIVNAGVVKNTLFYLDYVTIPAGTYNYQQLYKLITDGINKILRDPNNLADLQYYRAVALADIDNTDDQITEGNVSFSIGLMKNEPTATPQNVDMVVDTDNFINSSQIDANGEYIAYKKTTPNTLMPTGLRIGKTGINTFVQGTPDKTPGLYPDNNVIALGGTGAGGRINFTVLPDGSIDMNTITVITSGDLYTIGETLTIDNTFTGGTQDTTFNVLLLIQSSGLPFFDNYMLSLQHYWHIGYNDDTPYDNANIIVFETLKSADDLVASNGCVQIGLYSSEVAKGINHSNGTYPLNSGKRTGGPATGTSNGTDPNPQNTPLATAAGRRQLAAPMIVSIDGRGASCKLQVLGAKFANGAYEVDGLPKWTSCNHPISSMRSLNGVQGRTIANIPGYDTADPFIGGIQTYYDVDDLENNRVYFRVLNLNTFIHGNKSINENHITNEMILYDSKSAVTPSHFPDKFFRATDPNIIDYTKSGVRVMTVTDNGTADKNNGQHNNILVTNTSGTGVGLQLDFQVVAGLVEEPSLVVDGNNRGDLFSNGDTFIIPNNQGVGGTADTQITVNQISDSPLLNKVASQMPFNIICGSLNQDDGFKEVKGPLEIKDPYNPLSFIQSYELECSEELSRYINLPSSQNRKNGLSRILYPNTGDAMNSNLLHVENMSLDWRNESYSILLKELPIRNYKNNENKKLGGFPQSILANCPVPFSDSQSYQSKSKQMVSSTYKPNYQIINNLYNQAMTTNHFSVEIRKLQSDRPASEIKRSVINFTILPPDDYKGNINSVDSLKAS